MDNRPPIKDDVALDDKEVCRVLNISKTTRRRWEEKYGLPEPSFYIGQRGFTWQSDLKRWLDSRPTESALAGRSIPRASDQQKVA